MRTAQRLLSGAGWLYSAQIVTVIVQFGYAAITSRSVDDGGFGAYAIALSVAGFVTLIANGGLGQSVGRMIEIEQSRLRSLVTYSLLLGTFSAIFTFATSSFWAWLWGASDAGPLIRWYSIVAFISPLLSLLRIIGLAGREGVGHGNDGSF